MRQELEEKLFEKYPKIFPGGRNVDERVSLLNFGFDCGDGWYQIIDDLCGAIQDYIDNVKMFSKDGDVRLEQVVAEQVKEKFGELRFYYRGGHWKVENTDEYTDDCSPIQGMVALSEHRSRNTCEVCGKPGELRGGAWIRCLCDECDKK